jgi:hypothetical protein
MSDIRRKRQIERVTPDLGTRIILAIQRRIRWVIGLVLGAGAADFFKGWIGGNAMDRLFGHFGSLGIFVLRYKFAVLTLAIIVILLWLAWVALREAYISQESIIADYQGMPFRVTHVSKKWANWFLVSVVVCILFVGYGVIDYYHSSFLLNTYPLGYVIFDMDTVSGAVTPMETRRGMEAYQFDFRPVRILENTPTRITIQLPDVLKNHVSLVTGARIGGDRATMQKFGSGYLFSDGKDQIWAVGQVLRYEGERIVWVLGFQRTHIVLPS